MEAEAEILSGLIRVWVKSVDPSVPYVATVTFSASLGHAILKGMVRPLVETQAEKMAIGRAIFRELRRIGIKTWEWERKSHLPSHPPVIDTYKENYGQDT